MLRRTRRWRAPPPKVLSLPTSKHTELCYAFEGNAYAGDSVSMRGRTNSAIAYRSESHTGSSPA